LEREIAAVCAKIAKTLVAIGEVAACGGGNLYIADAAAVYKDVLNELLGGVGGGIYLNVLCRGEPDAAQNEPQKKNILIQRVLLTFL
tara:strand:+ start:28897 stop:29157 length:261 start_codon:yes stop_codon:yes gene_type:complete